MGIMIGTDSAENALITESAHARMLHSFAHNSHIAYSILHMAHIRDRLVLRTKLKNILRRNLRGLCWYLKLLRHGIWMVAERTTLVGLADHQSLHQAAQRSALSLLSLIARAGFLCPEIGRRYAYTALAFMVLSTLCVLVEAAVNIVSRYHNNIQSFASTFHPTPSGQDE